MRKYLILILKIITHEYILWTCIKIIFFILDFFFQHLSEKVIRQKRAILYKLHRATR